MYACINGSCTVEWAQALINCGFNSHSQAVTSVLGGAKPHVIARLHKKKMKIDADIIPPELGKPADLSAMNAALNSKITDATKQANGILGIPLPGIENAPFPDEVRSENK